MQHSIKKLDNETRDAIAAYLARNAPTQCAPKARALKPGQIKRADQFAVAARGHASLIARATAQRPT